MSKSKYKPSTSTPQERAEASRRAVQRRWRTDPAALDRYVTQLVRRWDAVTPEQRARIAAVVRTGKPEDQA